ncbi:MAG: hypothetical protein AB7I50_12610 [Vicinamibacterales bacterium]
MSAPAFRQGTVPVRRVFVDRGQRWLVVGPCPWCGGEHTHTFPTSDQTPGRRMAPCTAREPGEYFLQAPPELLDREASHQRRRRTRATAGKNAAPQPEAVNR